MKTNRIAAACKLRSSGLAVVAATLALMATTTAQAVPTYVGYPAPGEPVGDFASNGVPFNNSSPTARRGTYDQFTTPGAYGQLFFGEQNDQQIGVSMNAGNTITGAEWMSIDSITGNLLKLIGSTSLFNPSNSTSYTIATHLDISLFTVSGNNPIPWATTASQGLSGNGFLADVTSAAAGAGFYYDALMYACGGIGGAGDCRSTSQLFAANNAGSTASLQTSVNTGFFTTAAASAPEPASLALLGLGLAGLGFSRCRKIG